MAQDDGQERTEQPTQKRLDESREKGQIPRSRDLTTMAVMLVGGFGMLMLGDDMVRKMLGLLHDSFTLTRDEIFDTTLLYNRFIESVSLGVDMLLPLLMVLLLVAFVAPMALGGWAFSVQAMEFKWDKLDPIKGLGRVFGWKGMVELFKALAKFALVAAVAGALLWLQFEELLGLSQETVEGGLSHMTSILFWSFIILSASLVVIAAIDVPFQLWDHTRQLRMTRQEIKDEYKQTEGSPEVKGRIRSLQHEIARRRMMQQVPKADVVITNPSHYAVALKYDQARMGAPRVVAMGTEMVALRIRAVAGEHRVPIVEAPPLARALYYGTELDQEIPAGLYLAVAKVLAYVFQLQMHQNSRGPQPKPLDEADLPIPDDLKRDQ
ncbi:MAG: flagellar biosynthesis protein FlhB [Pseudomonadota bacterium]